MSSFITGGMCNSTQLGTIDKCPHCDRTNIKRLVPAQFTCGLPTCKKKQAAIKSKARRARARKAERAMPEDELVMIPLTDLDLMIRQGWGETPRTEIPKDWRTRKGDDL